LSRPFSRSFQSREPLHRRNGKIRAREVRVIGGDKQQLGVMTLDAALRLARDQGVDLVEIAAAAVPPVCRIVDYGKFYPIVQKATQKTGVTAAYKKVTETASGSSSLGSFGSAVSGSLLGKDSSDIDAYVTNKALEGLFKMVAEEEKHIRENPVARTTDILQKVFGVLKTQ